LAPAASSISAVSFLFLWAATSKGELPHCIIHRGDGTVREREKQHSTAQHNMIAAATVTPVVQ